MPLNLITHFLQNDKRYCKVCFSEIKINNFHSLLDKNISICDKCLEELSPFKAQETINGVKGYYLFKYNDVIREKIFTLKGCGDIELSSIFLSYFIYELKIKFKGYYIIPSPSDITSDSKRGFNHVQEIYKSLKLPILPILYKNKEFKQSDRSKASRSLVKYDLDIKNIEKIKNKKILFVDDISTTGETLKASLDLIKKGKPKKLNFLIIAKVQNNEESI